MKFVLISVLSQTINKTEKLNPLEVCMGGSVDKSWFYCVFHVVINALLSLFYCHAPFWHKSDTDDTDVCSLRWFMRVNLAKRQQKLCWSMSYGVGMWFRTTIKPKQERTLIKCICVDLKWIQWILRQVVECLWWLRWNRSEVKCSSPPT